MDESQLDRLLENEKEWRRYMIEKVEKIATDQVSMKAWNLVFRIIGGCLFAIIIALIERGTV